MGTRPPSSCAGGPSLSEFPEFYGAYSPFAFLAGCRGVCGRSLQDSVGRDDQNLSWSLAFVSPAMSTACGNAGGVASFEIVYVIFKRQFNSPLKHHRQLLRLPHVGFVPACSARLNRNDHGL